METINEPIEELIEEPIEPTTCEGSEDVLPYCSGCECPLYAECVTYGFRLPR